MRKTRIVLSVTLIFICMLFLGSCRCYPDKYDWGLVGIRHEDTYVNGRTQLTWKCPGAYTSQPNGIHSGMVNIKFNEDGTVIFKPYDSEKLQGTYTLKHNGFKNTYFTVIFENGEKIEKGLAGSYYGADTLEFEFRGIEYEFTTRGNIVDEETYYQQREQLAQAIRTHRAGLEEGVVALEENGAKLTSDELEEDIDLYAEGCAVTAMQITAENELVELDEIKGGECIFYKGEISAAAGAGKSYSIVIYYVDPLPENIEPQPEAIKLADEFFWLGNFAERVEVEGSCIKMTRALSDRSLIGYTDYHRYITDTEELVDIVDILMSATLTETVAPDLEHLHFVLTIELISPEGDVHKLNLKHLSDGIVQIGDKYYTYDQFPEFDYKDSVMTFITQNDVTKVYYSNEFVKNEYMYDLRSLWEGLEFAVDPKQDYLYTTAHDIRTLVCDFGEVTVYDATHFWYKGQFYIVTGYKSFSELY